MIGEQPHRQPDSRWVYPPIGEALEAAGLGPVAEYINRRQNNIAQYITMRPIYEI